MKEFIYGLIWRMKGVKVYALVGRSGTGKSFRAKLVSQKYRLDIIIDDGLLIKNEKILAGRSAKKERAYLSAIKTALFDDPRHRREALEALDGEKFKRVLIIGTSDKMVQRISHRIGLPQPFKIIHIEDIATEEEIEKAINSRQLSGKHVIPVPAVEVARNYPHILYETVKVILKKGRFFLFAKAREYEKSVVRPEFSMRGKISISEAALTQMVLHCADEYDSSIHIQKVSVKSGSNGYIIAIFLEMPFGAQLSGNLHGFQAYVIENIERYTGIMIEKVDIQIQHVSTTHIEKPPHR
ncbi:MAG: hypothetical protein CMN78_01835 [Spirochaetales bacterium]|nr:hypothetical protein [Spirochaetales bacterium]